MKNSSSFITAGLKYLFVSLITLVALSSRAEIITNPTIQDLRLYTGISYAGKAGVPYELQYCTNLQDSGGWITLTNVILDTNRLFFVDLDSPLSSRRFYRLHEIAAASPSALLQPEAKTSSTAEKVKAMPPFKVVPASVPITVWGSTIDPGQDCKVTTTANAINIEVPGTAHDFAAELGRWNAPRILTNIEGDFILETWISGGFHPGKNSTIPGRFPYHGAGLLLVQDQNNHLSLQRGAVLRDNHIRHYANFEWRHGPDNKVANYEFEIEDKDIYLRLARTGNKILAMTSQDGTNWRAFNPLTVDFPSTLQVGVEAISSSQAPLSCSFHGLTLYPKSAVQETTGK